MPIARNVPSSWVRSRTAIHIVFIIPTPMISSKMVTKMKEMVSRPCDDPHQIGDLITPNREVELLPRPVLTRDPLHLHEEGLWLMAHDLIAQRPRGAHGGGS